MNEHEVDHTQRIARAERILCEKAGRSIIEIVQEVEKTCGVTISEFSVKIEPHNELTGEAERTANCVIVE